MKNSLILLMLLTLSASEISGNDFGRELTVTDVSKYSCYQCLSSTSSYWCSNGIDSQCCSGSNFYSDKCSSDLKKGTCSNLILNSQMKYSICAFDAKKCGTESQIITANATVQTRKTYDTKSSGYACAYKIYQSDGQRLVLRFTNVTNATIYALTSSDNNYTSSVLTSFEITQAGSTKLKLNHGQVLFLNILMFSGNVTFSTYTIGQTDYMISLRDNLMIFFFGFLGLILFLLLTQKCRVVHIIHYREIDEYRQRKYLYKEFQVEEIFAKNQAIMHSERQNDLDDIIKNGPLNHNNSQSFGKPLSIQDISNTSSNELIQKQPSYHYQQTQLDSIEDKYYNPSINQPHISISSPKNQIHRKSLRSTSSRFFQQPQLVPQQYQQESLRQPSLSNRPNLQHDSVNQIGQYSQQPGLAPSILSNRKVSDDNITNQYIAHFNNNMNIQQQQQQRRSRGNSLESHQNSNSNNKIPIIRSMLDNYSN